MDSKNIKGLCEAYVAIYDDEVKEDLEIQELEDLAEEEDLSFIDDLSDNELTQIMEEIFNETTLSLDECFSYFDVYLSEAKTAGGARITRGGESAREKRAARSTARVTAGAGSGGGFDRARRAETTAQRKRQVRLGRLAQAAQTAAEFPGKQARRGVQAAKALGSEAARKIQSGKQKVMGFLGRVGKAAKSGYSTIKGELTGKAAEQAQGRTNLRRIRRALEKQKREAAGRDTSEFERPGGTYRTVGGERTRVGRLQYGSTPTEYDTSSSRRAAAMKKAAASARGQAGRGVRFVGPEGGVSKRMISGAGGRAQRNIEAGKFAKKLGMAEEMEFILSQILDDLVYEGYAVDYDDAADILESLNDYDYEDLIESYIEDNTVDFDFYDTVLDHLIDEGYAETIEDAETIMANMGQEWRDEILDEVTGFGGHIDPRTGKLTGKVSPAQQRSDKYVSSGLKTDTRRSKPAYENPYKTATTARHAGYSRSSVEWQRQQEPNLAMTPARRAELAAKRAERGGDKKRANKIRARMSNPNMG